MRDKRLLSVRFLLTLKGWTELPTLFEGVPSNVRQAFEIIKGDNASPIHICPSQSNDGRKESALRLDGASAAPMAIAPDESIG